MTPPAESPASGSRPSVRVLESPEIVAELALDELRAVVAGEVRPLISFATGNSYELMLGRLAAELNNRRISLANALATHLDEYSGLLPSHSRSMVCELVTRCPPLRDMLTRGTFLPVPSDGSATSIAAHEERLARAGGVRLQFLGIGRNGHLAFNEPGASFTGGFQVVTLAQATRDDARKRFGGEEPPRKAVSAGLASIMAARRIVLVALGRGKAPVVKAMLEGDVGPHCPASIVREHDNAVILLDREAAAELTASGARELNA